MTQDNDCLAGQRAGAWLRCTVTGSATDTSRMQLQESVRQLVGRAFHDDPFELSNRSYGLDHIVLLLCIQLLISFLWLAATGAFGYATLRPEDALALLPCLVALAIREGLTLHSIQEIEIQFATGLTVRHSVIYPVFQLFFAPLVANSQAFLCHLNGVLGAVAVLPLYLFVRQRTGHWQAALLAGLFFAVHPVLARFAPTDGPNSLLLLTWFSGLALLSAPTLNAETGLAGAALLGIAATCRMEGSLFLVASLFMLDARALFREMRRFPAAAVEAIVLVGGLIAIQMHYLLESHVSRAEHMARFVPRIRDLLQDVLLQPESEGPVFAALLVAGAIAGLTAQSWRLGAGAVLGAFLVIAPVTGTGSWIVARHEMVPGCALRVLAAGVGAAWLLSPIARLRRFGWLSALPGALAAGWLFWSHRAALQEKFLFNQEYEMVRNAFGPSGSAGSGCVLLALSSEGDLDVHHFEQVVPDTRVVDCRTTDCAEAFSWSPCTWYLRSVGCYRGPADPPTCREGTGDPQRRPECLNPRCLRLESAALLQAVDVRTVDVYSTFPVPETYPPGAVIGLYRASARGTGDTLRTPR
jgi:hypothetical protein